MAGDAAPPTTERSGELAGQVIDGFAVIELLGRGGMAEVYKAMDGELSRLVALKIVNELRAGDEDFVRRFEREAQAASAINHPNVAQIYSIGRWRGRPYFAMELVEGPSLSAILALQGRLSGLKCLTLLAQAAAGLRAAAERGVVHRDVKPSNLVIDDRGQLKVVDFGLARRLSGDDTLTRSDAVIGTPRYISPEQALAAPVDHRSDIYSLGAAFYHALAGAPPFDADTPVALMMKHVHETLPPLQERCPNLPRSVSAIVERMLAKRPEDRYQSYDELLADVARVQAGRTTARPAAAPAAGGDAAAVRSAVIGRAVVMLAILAVVLAAAVIIGQGGRGAGGESNGARRPAPPEAIPAPTATPAPRLPFGLTPAGAIEMAFKAKTLANMKQLATALQVWMAEEETLPAALAAVEQRYEIDPEVRLDGWGREIAYEVLEPRRFRLASAGADGEAGNADDVVMENSRVVRGEPELPPGMLR